MKHAVCLFMAACFAAVFLAACGNTAIPEQNTASQSSSVEQDSGNEENVSEATEEAETPAEATQEASFPVENAKRAAVVAITNALATDVFAADKNTVDPTKYHSYADLTGYYMIVTSWGTWNAEDDATWHVDGLEMHPNKYNTVACVSLDVTYDGDNYVVSKVSGPYGKANDLSDIETFSYADTYLTVASSLIADGRSN